MDTTFVFFYLVHSFTCLIIILWFSHVKLKNSLAKGVGAGGVKGVMNHPSGFVRKHILRKAETAIVSSAKYCSRAQPEEFRSGAQLCHFVRRSFFYTEAYAHSFRSCWRLLFDVEQQIACYWPKADIIKEQRLNQTCFLPRGAAMCQHGTP